MRCDTPLSRVSTLALELFDLIVPPRCAGCGGRAYPMLCRECEALIEYIQGPYCRRCGEPEPPAAHGWPLCEQCRERKRPALDGARAVALHYGPLREAILNFKFNGEHSLARPLGQMLARRVRNERARPHHLPWEDFDALVPAALHTRRRRWRGFDQALLLCKEMARDLEKPVWADVLTRVKETTPQIGLSPTQREENLHNAFESRSPGKTAGRSLLLVDDVCTTGATLYEAARALKKGGAAAVYAITITRRVPSWHPESFPSLDRH